MILALASILYLAIAAVMAWGLSVFLGSPEAHDLRVAARAMGTSAFLRIAVYFAFCCLCWPATIVWLAMQKQVRDTIVNAYRKARAANKAEAKVTGRIDAEFEEGP